jgi:hypothetical protein
LTTSATQKQGWVSVKNFGLGKNSTDKSLKNNYVDIDERTILSEEFLDQLRNYWLLKKRRKE